MLLWRLTFQLWFSSTFILLYWRSFVYRDTGRGIPNFRMERRQKVVFQCSICYDRIKKPAMLRDCEHVFCFDCVTHWLESQRDKRSCPFCRCEVNTVTSPIVHIRPRFNSAEIAAVSILIYEPDRIILV